MFILGFPLLLIPFAIYNIIAFLFQLGFTDTVFSIRMLSQATWAVTTGDLLIFGSLVLLFLEILKSTRLGMRAIFDHMLSLALFIAMLGEFMIVGRAATSTFFTMIIISLIDVVAGFSVTIRTAQRDIGISPERLGD